MEKNVYTIGIRHDQKLGQNEYVQGRISGIMLAMCGLDENGHAPSIQVGNVVNNKIGITYLRVVASDSTKFWKCCELIEELYPGLCIFG